MIIKIFVSLLMTAGFFLIFNINPLAALDKLRGWRPVPVKRKQTAAAFMRELEGKKKENLFKRSLNETKNSLTTIGQANKYRNTVRLAVFIGAVSSLIAFIFFSSPVLAAVLGVGCGFIPLWLVNLSVYAYSKEVNNALETALSMITTSYTRHNDIVLAVKETLPHTENPIKSVLARYVKTVDFIDANNETAILQMKSDLDNALFHQWCDILILCQSDHTLKAGLQPVVSKISQIKAQQEKNETKMMLPLRETVIMVLMACCPIPLLMLINPEWYGYLVHTAAGQTVMSGVALIIFWSINKAIKLSKPIDYRL